MEGKFHYIVFIVLHCVVFYWFYFILSCTVISHFWCPSGRKANTKQIKLNQSISSLKHDMGYITSKNGRQQRLTRLLKGKWKTNGNIILVTIPTYPCFSKGLLETPTFVARWASKPSMKHYMLLMSDQCKCRNGGYMTLTGFYLFDWVLDRDFTWVPEFLLEMKWTSLSNELVQN